MYVRPSGNNQADRYGMSDGYYGAFFLRSCLGIPPTSVWLRVVIFLLLWDILNITFVVWTNHSQTIT